MFDTKPKSPCKGHPNWEKAECPFHKRRGGTFTTYGNTHLNARARESLQYQLGVPVSTREDVTKIMKERNLEFVAPGDDADRLRRDMKEWRNEPAATRGPAPRAEKK